MYRNSGWLMFLGGASTHLNTMFATDSMCAVIGYASLTTTIDKALASSLGSGNWHSQYEWSKEGRLGGERRRHAW